MRTTTPFFHRQKSNVKRALEKITAKVAPAFRLAAIDAAGPGGCGQSDRQSRCGDQSGERTAPGDATGLAGAGVGVRAGVISRHSTNRPRGPPALWGCNRRRGRQELNHGAFSLNCDPRNNFLANFYWKDAPIHDKWGAIYFVIYRFTFKASA